MSEVPHLRHRLLTQEAPLRESRSRSSSPASAGRAPAPKSGPMRAIPRRTRQVSMSAGVTSHEPRSRRRPSSARAGSPGATTMSWPLPRTDGVRTTPASPSSAAPPPRTATMTDRSLLIVQLDVGREHVRGEDLVDRLGLLAWLGGGGRAVARPRDMEVGPDPPGRRQEQRAPALSGSQPFHVRGDEIVEPRLGVGTAHRDRAPRGPRRECFPALSASSSVDPVVPPGPPRRPRARRVGCGPVSPRLSREPLWEDIGPVEIPRTLVVTNDFPPRVGGIQRTLGSLCRDLPAERLSVIAPSCGGLGCLRRGVPASTSSGSDAGSSGRRPRSPTGSEAEVARTSAEVVLFGDAFPLALLGPRLATRGHALRRPRARLRLLALHRARSRTR